MDNDNTPQDEQNQPRTRSKHIGSSSFHVSPPIEEISAEPIETPSNQAGEMMKPDVSLAPTEVAAAPAESMPEAGPLALEETEKTPQKKVKREGGAFSLILTIIVAIIFVQIINAFLFQSYRVVGHSMYPTLEEGDFLIISKVGKTFSKISRNEYEPKRNDIIVFKSPRDELQLVKRVIGLPGERVTVKSGKITVYNKENPKGFNPDSGTDYIDTLPITSGNVDVDVPDGHLFVSGDNREGGNSLDSRNELGTIPESLVVGILSVRIFPLSKAKFF